MFQSNVNSKCKMEDARNKGALSPGLPKMYIVALGMGRESEILFYFCSGGC